MRTGKRTRKTRRGLAGLLLCLGVLLAMAAPGRAQAAGGTVTATIERFTLGGGFIVEPEILTFNAGDNYADVCQRLLKEKGLKYSYNMDKDGFYLQGIDGVDCGMDKIPQCVLGIFEARNAEMPWEGNIGNLMHPGGLYEFCYAPGAGWMYYVNNEYRLGMSSVKPENGDVVRFQFSLNGGMDLMGCEVNDNTGETTGVTYYTVADKTELVRKMGEYNQVKAAWTAPMRKAYAYAVEVMETMDASEFEVEAALSDLKTLQSIPSIGQTGNVKVKADSKAVTVSWNAVSGANGYVVERSTDQKNYKQVAKTTGTGKSCKDGKAKELKANKNYYYRVRAYRKLNSQTLYGPWSSAVKLKVSVGTPGMKSVSAGKSIAVKWKKVSGASGYEVWHSAKKSSGYSKVKTVSGGSTVSVKDAKAKGLKAGAAYYYKVRAYRTIAGYKLYGSYSSPKSLKVSLSKPKISKATPGKKKATLKWKKVSGADGYQVQRSLYAKKGFSTVKVTVKKGSTVTCTNTKLKSKKTYYYKVRAYRTVGGVKLYSAWSSAAKVKAK